MLSIDTGVHLVDVLSLANHPISEAAFKYHLKQIRLDSDALQEAT